MESNMELSLNEADEIQSEKNDFTKESRKTRYEKLKQKNQYHKKNPKSVAYYAQTDNATNIAVSISPSEKKLESINMILDEMNEEFAPLQESSKENSRTKNSKKIIQEEVETSKNKEKQKNIVRLRQKTKFIYDNLTKSLKRDNIFLNISSSGDTVITMKDFHVNLLINDKSIRVSMRFVVGKYENFPDLVQKESAQFGKIKDEFMLWYRNRLSVFKPQQYSQDVINKIFHKASAGQLKKFMPNLETKLIDNLKKPTKQTHGFEEKAYLIYQQWLEQSQEIIQIDQVENELNFHAYEDSFPKARTLKRKFSIFIGPTNSGKTYEALNELCKGQTGVYLAPLRLMAQEGQESLFERGVLANLITGEEQKLMPNASHTSSTIEMCNMKRVVDVAVIDEIQMIADDSRGWAWSAAMIGVPAKHVVLVGSEEALPFIVPVLKSLGQDYSIKRFERKSPLNVREPVHKFKDLKRGDCVVVFSRKSALEMKNAIEATGQKCSVIYGNLSPDVRRIEAQKFKSGENQILVATDAIGMGLNLPIHRIFFSTMEKFDGTTNRYLKIGEIKQIAGRAGRYGIAEKGDVGLLMPDDWSGQTLLQKAVMGGYDQPTDTRISIAPNLEQIRTICEVIGKQDLYSALLFFKEKLIKEHKHYKTANLEAMIEIAGLIKNKKLDLADGLNYACVPIDNNSESHIKTFFSWINNHMQEKVSASPKLPEAVIEYRNDSHSLYEAENYVKLCMAYRWLHYKYPDYYPDIENVVKNCQKTNSYIEQTLHKHIVMSKNPKWRR